MRRSVGPWTLAEVVVVMVVVALILSVAANITTSVQAYSNCHKIELLKTQTRSVLSESLADMKSGALDQQFQNFYGDTWEVEKQKAIDKAEERVHKFDAEKCHLFIH